MNIMARNRVGRHTLLAVLTVILALVALIFGVSQVLAGNASMPAQQTQPVGVVTAPVLNVRAGPGIGNEVIDTVVQGELVTIIGQNSDSSWYEIRTSDGIVGWSSSAFIDIVSTGTGADVPTSAPFEASGVVNTGTLNVRAAPNLFSAIVTTVNYGDGLALLGRNNDATWLFVRTEQGNFGWVSSGFVLANLNDLFVLPVVTTGGSTPSGGGAGGGGTAGGTTVTVVFPTNLRVAPDFNAAIITPLAQGTSVTVSGRNTDASFAFGTTGGNSGWVPSYALSNPGIVPTLPLVNDQGQSAGAPGGGGTGAGAGGGQGGGGTLPANTGIVTAFVLNVRTGPGIQYFVLTTVERGETVLVLGRLADGSWYKIQTNDGVVGWASSLYIDFAVPPGDIPIATS